MVRVSATALPDDAITAVRRRAIRTRLRTEDWTEMARPAFESETHPGNLPGWVAKARVENPQLSEEQTLRLAQHLKAEYFARLSQAGVEARRAKAGLLQAHADIEAIEDTGDMTGDE